MLLLRTAPRLHRCGFVRYCFVQRYIDSAHLLSHSRAAAFPTQKPSYIRGGQRLCYATYADLSSQEDESSISKATNDGESPPTKDEDEESDYLVAIEEHSEFLNGKKLEDYVDAIATNKIKYRPYIDRKVEELEQQDLPPAEFKKELTKILKACFGTEFYKTDMVESYNYDMYLPYSVMEEIYKKHVEDPITYNMSNLSAMYRLKKLEVAAIIRQQHFFKETYEDDLDENSKIVLRKTADLHARRVREYIRLQKAEADDFGINDVMEELKKLQNEEDDPEDSELEDLQDEIIEKVKKGALHEVTRWNIAEKKGKTYEMKPIPTATSSGFPAHLFVDDQVDRKEFSDELHLRRRKKILIPKHEIPPTAPKLTTYTPLQFRVPVDDEEIIYSRSMDTTFGKPPQTRQKRIYCINIENWQQKFRRGEELPTMVEEPDGTLRDSTSIEREVCYNNMFPGRSWERRVHDESLVRFVPKSKSKSKSKR